MVEMSVQISIDYWECHLQGEKGGDVCCKKQSRHVNKNDVVISSPCRSCQLDCIQILRDFTMVE
jgi:hypothetical protein